MSSASLQQPRFVETATALPRLARIETRRSLGFWAVPILIVATWFANRQSFDDGVTLWVRTSAAIGFNLLVIGPLIGGLAAWEAGRERRRNLGDLLQTTPRPAISRDLGRWAAVTTWGMVAYLLFGAYQFIEALREATWGGPDFSPMVVGLVGIGAYTAVGYALAVVAPSRFLVPMVPLVLLGWFHLLPIGITDRNRTASRFLSPYSFLNPEEHGIAQGIWPDISAPLVLWLGGIAATAMAIVGLRRARTRAAAFALIASLLLASGGAIWILQTDYSAGARAAATIRTDPTCVEASVPVCTHPARSAVLDETATVVEVLVAPIAGIDGAPTRINSMSWNHEDAPFQSDTTLTIPFYAPSAGTELLAQDLAQLLFTSDQYSRSCFSVFDNAQYAVAEALLRPGGWSLKRQGGPAEIMTCETEAIWEDAAGVGPPNQRPEMIAMIGEIEAATDRFAALSGEEQRAWFMTHYAGLRAGNLTLEDLP